LPKRTDIHKVLIIGSGPIVIGQACEFDYSGTQACKALRAQGYEIVLINSNPATIMTDPEIADHTYIEPITPEVVEGIIEEQRPDALLPTLGGQTGLNTAIQVHENGVLDRFAVEMIGASYESIQKAEDREFFQEAMAVCGQEVPTGVVLRAETPRRPDELTREAIEGYEAARLRALNRAVEEAVQSILPRVGLPCVIRPAYTLGGTGGGIAYNSEELEEFVRRGLEHSLIGEVLIEESVIGWKEYELEVMRDKNDNVVIICSIENFDPMGVHTGDSITVAPAQTLTDKEYQRMRDASIAIIREIGVETGGSNIQFAVNPEDGRMLVIEMNPRVSRSSALASKATGFPIAKIAALLAVGYTLDEIPNDITKETYAGFEPTIDYCVTKFPRWAFEKFPEADNTLTTQMKSVGEVMAIGRTFKESLQKAIRSLETVRDGLGPARNGATQETSGEITDDQVRSMLRQPNPDRVFHIRQAFLRGMPLEEIYELTHIDRWFLRNIFELCEFEDQLRSYRRLDEVPDRVLREAKRLGYGDAGLGAFFDTDELSLRHCRKKRGVEATFKLVDTCAAEFAAYTPYYYSTYEDEDECRITDRKKVAILGSGPNRIGQGIEFDYCCVQAAFALKEMGFETIMVNSNPETVSTDYDTSDLLFFEPLTRENVLNICDRLKPEGIIVQFGGQTPLNIAEPLEEAGIKILGTSVQSIRRAEDRREFEALLQKLDLRRTPNAVAFDLKEVRREAARLGYPILLRPSYVLGGRAMFIIYHPEELMEKTREAMDVQPGRPVLIDKFLDDAIEVDVDCVADGTTAIVSGVMEHIEQAGVHSGDSACALPPYSLPPETVEEIKRQTRLLARELDVVGLMNVQYAVKEGDVYVLEVNPRASRTVPFVSKATGVPLARLAAKVMAGSTLAELGFTREVDVQHFSVKECVLPFNKFPQCDVILGPEMRSTGEVMGIASSFGMAFAKSQQAASQTLPASGSVVLTVRDSDKPAAVETGRFLDELGFEILATQGTHAALKGAGVASRLVQKMQEGRPHILDALMNGEVHLVISTPSRRGSRTAEARIRRYAVMHSIPVITTMAAAQAAVQGMRAMKNKPVSVRSLQQYHKDVERYNT